MPQRTQHAEMLPAKTQHQPEPSDLSDPNPRSRGLRTFGLGVITGAADDDCSAIGTYATAGAKYGPAMLWTAPVALPMMFSVVYLSAKLGQVTGRGLFQAIKEYMPAPVLYLTLAAVMIGNTIEAAADLGGMAAGINIYVPVPIPSIVVVVAMVILALQIFGSYTLIRNTFRWLALALLTYVVAAVLAKPNAMTVLRGTFIPHVRFDAQFLSLLVAIIGTSLSAYIYTWKSNEEVEEQIAEGRTTVEQREGATRRELRTVRRDVFIGMLFSSIVMYFIMLSTSATLFKSGKQVDSAAQAAEALRPLAGNAAGVLFATGLIAVGFLAVPVMTAGGAYDLVQAFNWRYSLHARPRQAIGFYLSIVGITIVAVGLNFLGLNPIKALVWAGIVQGFSTPPLLLLIMLMTNNRRAMGNRVNTRPINILGWATTAVIFGATGTLVATWFL
jgi:NRAMP (natural resistance-associated macrophage protein)-like metal ion transporter